MTVSDPDIPVSIIQPFAILSGLSGSGSYSGGPVGGNFDIFSFSYQLTPLTIYVTVDGIAPSIPEPSTWAMLLIGFAGIGFAGYRKRKRALLAA
jgi:hypothetical protein